MYSLSSQIKPEPRGILMSILTGIQTYRALRDSNPVHELGNTNNPQLT